MLRAPVLVAALAAAGLLAAAPAAPAAVNLLVADSNAGGDSTGAIFGVGLTGAQSLVANNQRSIAVGGPGFFSQPTDVMQESDGNLLVVDSQGSDLVDRITRVDPATGRQTAVSSNAMSAAAGGAQAFQSIVDVIPGPAGQVYVVDADATTGGGTEGAIIRVNLANGAQTVMSDDAISAAQGGETAFHNPYGAVGLPGGGLAVADDPSGSNGNSTAGIIAVTPSGKQSMFSSNAISQAQGGDQPFNSPQSVARGPDGSLYVADYAGTISKVSATGRATTLASGAPMSTPKDIEYGPDGFLYVTDPTVGGSGAVWRLGTTPGAPVAVSNNAISAGAGGLQGFANPTGLAVSGSVTRPPVNRPVTPAAVPQCRDGRDNDADGARDLADPGCANAADNRESDESIGDLVLCGRRKISLVRADAKGRKVALSGLVALSLAGKKVTLYQRLGGKRKKLKTVTPSKAGEFKTSVPGPRRRAVNKVRYFAQVEGSKSVALKLPQSLASTTARARGGAITIKGKVQKALVGKRNVVVIKRLVCGRYTTVGQAKPKKNGSYTVSFKAPAQASAALYRAESMVLARPGSKRYVKQFARAIGIAL